MTVKIRVSDKIKYRVILIGLYILFIILSVLAARFADTYKRTSFMSEKGGYTDADYEYKKGDMVNLKIYFTKEYIGREVIINFCNESAGVTTEIYKGDALKVLRMTYRVDADGPAKFMVNLSLDNKNITDEVVVFAAVRHTK